MSMLYPAMNKLTSYVPNRYMLENVVARRARQIAETAEATGEHLDEKPVTLAIHEVADGKLDASRMVEVVLEDGKITEVDCCYGSCVYQSECTVGKQISGLEEKP